MGLVVIAGAGTMLVVVLLVAHPAFHSHLDQFKPPLSAQAQSLVDEAFAGGVFIALAVGVTVALATALVVTWLVAKRLAAPMSEAANAAHRIADGDYETRLRQPGLGPEFDRLTDLVQHDGPPAGEHRADPPAPADRPGPRAAYPAGLHRGHDRGRHRRHTARRPEHPGHADRPGPTAAPARRRPVCRIAGGGAPAEPEPGPCPPAGRGLRRGGRSTASLRRQGDHPHRRRPLPLAGARRPGPARRGTWRAARQRATAYAPRWHRHRQPPPATRTDAGSRFPTPATGSTPPSPRGCSNASTEATPPAQQAAPEAASA